MKLKLQDIFIVPSNQRRYTKQELFGLKISSQFIDDMEAWLGLSYWESHPPEGNLCFANTRDVRAEFRTVFSKTDIIYLISAVLQKDHFDVELDAFFFPTQATSFWLLVEKGRQLI